MARHQRRGIFLITFAIWAVLLLGVGGAALDGGRLFVNRNEAQAYADAAALSAARMLDGTPAGLRAARQAVQTSGNAWDFGTREVDDTTIEFSTTAAPRNWLTEPPAGTGYTRVRVTAQVNQRLFFAPLFLVRNLQLVRVSSVAEQARVTEFKHGLPPLSVLAFEGQPAPHFGLRPGEQYTIRYANSNACRGDQADASHLREGPSRTWWGRNSDSVLRERILAGAQDPSEQVTAGKPFSEVSAPKEAAGEFLETRRKQDTDSTSAAYSEYAASGAGNGRRVVVLPIQDSGGVKGFGMFFLLALPEPSSGRPWCVEYTGKASLPNSSRAGAGLPGAYAIRLVR